MRLITPDLKFPVVVLLQSLIIVCDAGSDVIIVEIVVDCCTGDETETIVDDKDNDDGDVTDELIATGRGILDDE